MWELESSRARELDSWTVVQPCNWPWKGQTVQSLTCSILEKPYTGLDVCQIILLSCFRARNSAFIRPSIPFCLRVCVESEGGREGFLASLWHKDARNPFPVPLIPCVFLSFPPVERRYLSNHTSAIETQEQLYSVCRFLKSGINLMY